MDHQRYRADLNNQRNTRKAHMVSASTVWLLVLLQGSMTSTAAPQLIPFYVTEQESTCAAQRAAWVKRLPPIYANRLVCLPHRQKDFDPIYRL
jgi:hypothetical protein